ncbi:MAG TPA: hypothetical protein VFH48_02405 [Chloroflexota bacterium]|nr:hypothetical protein [Chloroflexota bacterium]
MTTTYEVWDMESANQIGSFGSESDARAFLRDMLRLNGAAAVKALSVAAIEHDQSGVVDQKLILEGPDFVAEIERASRGPNGSQAASAEADRASAERTRT